MSKQILHITFGRSDKTVLPLNGCSDPNIAEVIDFYDPLSMGPLCDLDKAEKVAIREQWHLDNFGSIESETGPKFIDENLTLLNKVIATAEGYHALYLWLGEYADEQITAARLLYHLQGTDVIIYKPNLSKADFRNAKGTKIAPCALNLMSTDQLMEAARHFEILNDGDRLRYALLWQDVVDDDSVIRIIDRSGILHRGDESFVDRYLLNRCTPQPQSSARIVGYALCDSWVDYGFSTVGDLYLFHRLNCLAEMGKLEITDRRKDNGQRIFKVRLAPRLA